MIDFMIMIGRGRPDGRTWPTHAARRLLHSLSFPRPLTPAVLTPLPFYCRPARPSGTDAARHAPTRCHPARPLALPPSPFPRPPLLPHALVTWLPLTPPGVYLLRGSKCCLCKQTCRPASSRYSVLITNHIPNEQKEEQKSSVICNHPLLSLAALRLKSNRRQAWFRVRGMLPSTGPFHHIRIWKRPPPTNVLLRLFLQQAPFISLKFGLCWYLFWFIVRGKHCSFAEKYCWSSIFCEIY